MIRYPAINHQILLKLIFLILTLMIGSACVGSSVPEGATDTPLSPATETPVPSNTPPPTDTPVPTATATPSPTDTPVPTSTSTPDLTATAALEATQAAEAVLAEIASVLEMAGLSTEAGSLLWMQTEPEPISLTGYSEMAIVPFRGDPAASDFALYSEFVWKSSGGLAGCDLIFRSEPNFKEGAQYELETLRLSGLPGWDIIINNYGSFQKSVTGFLTSGAIDQDHGARNKILLIAEGGKFTVYFNDQRMGSYYDFAETRQEGLFAFVAWQDTGKTTCKFENSWIWSLE